MPINTLQSEAQKIPASTAGRPKLRFPGFSGEWEEKKLGEDLEVIDGDRGVNYPNTDDFSKDGYCLFLNAKNVTKRGFLFEEKSFVTKEKDNQLRKGKLQRGDIVLTTRGSVGHIAYYNTEVPFDNLRINSGMVLLRGDQEITDSNFVYKFLSSTKMQNRIQRVSFGSAQPQLTVKEINTLKISFPSFPEQQKIAEFLGAVDEWIENLRAQKKSFESYKKGMMQKIFPSTSSGQVSPEIRFKDDKGNNFPEWEEKRLGEVGNIITGATPPTSDKECYGGNFPWITPTDIDSGKDIYTSAKLLTKKGIEKGRFISKNSLLVTCIASIGKNAILRIDGSCNQQINAITPDKNNNVDFLYYLLEKSKNVLIRFAGAGGMQMLNKKDFSDLKFKIPLLLEQQKIADFLTTLDNVIESKQQQITQAEQWKKGLMQGLFV